MLKWRRGERITADKLNRMAEAPPRMANGIGANVNVLSGNVAVQVTKRGPESLKRPVFARVMNASSEDYITCAFIDPLNPDAEISVEQFILVAKPFVLRRTPFDNETISYLDGTQVSYVYTGNHERTATNEDTTEVIQTISPPYFLGEIIRIVPGNTGVTVGGASVAWEDMNVSGRHWRGPDVQDAEPSPNIWEPYTGA